MHRGSVADEWKHQVRRAALDALGLVLPPKKPIFDRPTVLEVVATFRLRRPAKHFLGDNRTRSLRDDAPRWVGTKPDVDNLMKAVLDALGPWPSGSPPVLWADDDLVVRAYAEKVYPEEGQPTGAEITVRTVEPVSAGGEPQMKEEDR